MGNDLPNIQSEEREVVFESMDMTLNLETGEVYIVIPNPIHIQKPLSAVRIANL